MLCGIRPIPHGTRLARVCIFRYTCASSCHGLISYGTRRPRACGIPCVMPSCVPVGRASRTREGRVCRPPANWGQTCTAGAPSGTHLARVSCGRASSVQVCTGAKHCPYSWGPSLRTRCELGVGAHPDLDRARTYPARPCGIMRTRRGCVPRPRPRPHAPGPTLRSLASSGRACCAPGAAVAGTPRCVTPRWLREPWHGQPTCDHALSNQART